MHAIEAAPEVGNLPPPPALPDAAEAKAAAPDLQPKRSKAARILQELQKDAQKQLQQSR